MQRLRTRLRASASRGAPAALSLDFLSASGALDPRITFSRGSNATLTDSTGKITYAPTNFVTNSDGPQSSTGTTVSSGVAVAPNGTTTARRIAKTDATTPRYAAWSAPFTAQSNTSYVASAYFKYDGYDTQVSLEYNNAAQWGAVSWVAPFNVTASGVTAVAPSSCTSGVQAVGNGWFRVWAAFTTGTVSTAVTTILTRVTGASGVTVLAWGGQIEAVTYQTTPGTYNSTTPKNLLGFTQEFDNAAWTKSNAFVQTNLLTYSQDFGNAAWSSNAVTRVDNAIAAPDGTLTAEQFTPTTASATHTFWQIVSSVTSGATYSASYYIKPNGYTKVAIVENNITSAYTSFDLSGAGSVITNSAGSSGSVTAVGGGWYRIVHSSASGGTAFRPQLFILPNSYTSGAPTNSWVGDGTSGIYAWGAQLVQGSTAGDYQRTDAAAAAVQYLAPDGTLTADKLVENTAASTVHWVDFSSTSLVATGSVVTASVYLKAGERNWINLNLGTGQSAYFNLANGTVGTIAGTLLGTSITSVGNGWWRCSITAATAASTGRLSVYIATGNGTASYTGDGTSGIYIWGAQLSDSASLDPYVYNPAAAAASAAYYGPRFDYDPVTLAAKGLLIEEARTNICTYSAQFDLWTNSGATVTSNSTAAPSGETAADTIARATSASDSVYNTITFTGDGVKAISVWIKKGTSPSSLINLYDATATVYRLWADVTWSGTTPVLAFTNGSLLNSVNYGNGWWRLELATTAVTAANTNRFYIHPGRTGSANGDTVYCWGAQAENASFATSYIPTVASQVTRSADVATMIGDNFKSWYNQNEGTWLVSGSGRVGTGGSAALMSAASTPSNAFNASPQMDITSATATRGVYTNAAGSIVSNASVTVSSTATVNKYAAAFSSAGSAIAANGGAVSTNTMTSLPVPTQLAIGGLVTTQFLNGHLQSLGYYNTRQPNATLQTLTNPSTTPSLALNFISDTYTVGA